jgi:hypothetical protein
MPSVTRRIFLGSLICAPLAPSKSWDEPAFPAWTPEFVDRMLADSPWAKQGTLSFELDPVQRLQSSSYAQIGLPGGIGLPGAGIPGVGWPTGGSRTGTPPSTWPRSGGSSGRGSSVRTEIYLTTRWSSALPIRRALALQEFGAGDLDAEKAVEMLNQQPADYVIEVAGFPTTVIRQGAKRFAAELLDSARLLVRGRPPMPPTSAEVPEYGMHLVATLRFQRFKDLAPNEGLIELSAESGRMSIRERFKLKNMLYGGVLEL